MKAFEKIYKSYERLFFCAKFKFDFVFQAVETSHNVISRVRLGNKFDCCGRKCSSNVAHDRRKVTSFKECTLLSRNVNFETSLYVIVLSNVMRSR